jgi:hypothetical protein
MKPLDCRRECDCHHPSECIFTEVAPDRASFVLVWIVGAVTVAVAAAVILVVML